jgi:hypothetical protein
VAASTEILIGDPGAQHVAIRPLSRSHPGLFDQPDGNWIDCALHIVAGGFTGDFRADLRSEEFQTFLEETQGLVQTLQGTASFTTDEGQIALSLTADDEGHIRVNGGAIDDGAGGNRLIFGFEIDRSSLPAVCESLMHLLAAFPVRRELDTRG